MIRLLVPLAALFTVAPALAGEKEEDAAAQERVDKAGEAETLYALGALLGQKLIGFHLRAREQATVKRGFADAVAGRKLKLPEADLELWGPKVDAAMGRRITPEISAAQEKGKAFADLEARQPGAVRTATGLVLRTLTPGSGRAPVASDTVKVVYEGKLIDGKVFDSSAAHGGSAEMHLNQVIPCWTEGLQKMKTGEKARLVCPSAIAYGVQGRPPQIPGGATLVFDVELVEVKR